MEAAVLVFKGTLFSTLLWEVLREKKAFFDDLGVLVEALNELRPADRALLAPPPNPMKPDLPALVLSDVLSRLPFAWESRVLFD